MTQYLSAVKAAEVAGVAQQTIINHINKGTLKASPVRESNSGVTKKWMISEEDLLDWMEHRPKRERNNKMDDYLEEKYSVQDAYNKGIKDGEQRVMNKMLSVFEEEK